MGVLNDVLDRFDSRSTMASTLKEPVKILHDPELPYSEVTAMLSSLSGCMPAKLERRPSVLRWARWGCKISR